MAYIVLLSILVLLILLILDVAKPPVLFTALILFFYLSGLIDSDTLLKGFMNEALLTLVLVLLASVSFEKTIFIRKISDFFFTQGSEIRSLFKMVWVSLLSSALVNNTAIVALFLTIIKKSPVSNAKFLIPLSFASILGGVLTLIGTSTNLILNSLILESGGKPFAFFAFLPIGLPIAIVGGLYLIFLSGKILPRKNEEVEKSESNNNFFLEAVIEDNSPLIGKSIYENKLRNLENLFLVEIFRKKRLISPVSPEETLQSGDILLFSGDITKIQELEKFPGLNLHNEYIEETKHNLREVIVSYHSSLVNKKIRDVDFRSRFDAGVVAVKRGSQRLSGKLGDIRIQTGDQLVLAAGREFAKRESLDDNFYYVNTVPTHRILNSLHSTIVVFLFLGAILLNVLNYISLFKALVILIAIYFGLGFLTKDDMRSRLDFNVYFLVGSALGIAKVMINSGAADIIINVFLSIFQGAFGPWGGLITIYLATLVLTNIITNNAAVALSFPFAYGVAASLGADVMPFYMCIAFAASASFLTPFSYQTNLIVYSAGNYSMKDFFYCGFPLTILYSVLALLIIPMVFPF